MAEATQFSFDLREVATALIKQQGLHEGLWTLGFEFTFLAGIMGPTPSNSTPSVLVQMSKLQLIRQDQLPPPNPHLTVDAAEANPKAVVAK
jgi:hypothetical protein